MQENKYYLDEEGLNTLLRGIAASLQSQTTNVINATTEDNLWPTVSAIKDYCSNKIILRDW